MELYKEILARAIEQEKVSITFNNLEIGAKKIVELECYNALQKIKAIIEDNSLEDEDCFIKIEEIVCLFEELGSGGGGRHDF